jgi:Ca2+-dependent lipid-binding protein
MVGTLYVTVVNAIGLPIKDKAGSSDPYIKLNVMLLAIANENRLETNPTRQKRKRRH